MNILDGNLKSIEEAGLGTLDFGGKVTREVFVDNSIGCGEEGEDVGDEMTFIVGEAFPILEIGGKVNLLGGPEASLGLFVHAPYLYYLMQKVRRCVREYCCYWQSRLHIKHMMCIIHVYSRHCPG